MTKTSTDFITKIIDEFGEKILDSDNKITSIPSSSTSLNASIGIGGIPRGMITELYGPEGSGKTTLALDISKNVANAGEKVLYIDVENLLNYSILTSVLGTDVKQENIVFVTPRSAEDAFMVAEAGIEAKEFSLIVIDSIGAMASRKEKEVEFDKDTMGQLPRIVSKFVKRNVYDLRVNKIALLALNQIRDNVGSYVKSYKTPGGHLLQHQTTVRISLTKGENLTRGKEIVGTLSKFVIKKNKLAPPFRSFTLPIVFGEGIDMYSDLIDFATLIGVIKRGGSYYKFDEDTLGLGKEATKETLKNSKETLDKIVNMVYNVVNKESESAELLNDTGEEVEEIENED